MYATERASDQRRKIGNAGDVTQSATSTGGKSQVQTRCVIPGRVRSPGRKQTRARALVVAAVLAGQIVLAAPAFADSAAGFREAVAVARGATSCGAFRADPIVEQVAEVINRSTESYIDHEAAQVPIDDPMPGLHALGYSGKRAAVLRGAGKTEAEAIRGAIVEGYAVIHGKAALSDCGYKDFGVDIRFNPTKGYYLSSSVLAGP